MYGQRLWTGCAVFLFAASTSFAQQQPLTWPPVDGTLIRVTWIERPNSPLVGSASGALPDTLRFIPAGSSVPVLIRLADLRTVEVGKERNYGGQGALFGGLITGLGFFALAAATPGQDQGTGFAAGIGVGAGILGAAVGFLIGHAIHGETWTHLDISRLVFHRNENGIPESPPGIRQMVGMSGGVCRFPVRFSESSFAFGARVRFGKSLTDTITRTVCRATIQSG
jgi:hypothetical protein